MGYKIFQRNQGVQVLGSANSLDGTQFAHIVNRPPHGWMARKVELKDGEYVPTGDEVNVSRFINQHNGGEQIAVALGL